MHSPRQNGSRPRTGAAAPPSFPATSAGSNARAASRCMHSPRQNGSRLRTAAAATRSSPATSAPRSLPRPVWRPTRAFPSWTASRRTLSPMGMFFHAASEPPERAADLAVRRANLPRNDPRSLSWNAGGMIAIAVATGVLGVIQTLLSNQVGQRVMHDLRAAVFRHLQRLSLAFFTRTRTGEVQSRISNDIGGVQNVVTNTATSIASNVTTVVATMVGMLLLSWKLALFAFALIPLFEIGRAHV